MIRELPLIVTARRATWMAIGCGCLLAGLLLAARPCCAGQAKPRDVTFFVVSDPHIGVQEKNKPPRSTDQVVAEGRQLVARLAGLIGQPYPESGPLKGLGLGTVSMPRGLLIAGDLTDNLRWDAFTAIFPPGGIETQRGRLPVFLCVGNHDGDPDGPPRRGTLAHTEIHRQCGRMAAVSENGMHYAVNWDGVHLLCLGLYPADTVDAATPFKYGKPGPGSWNDPMQALAFLRKYLRERVGTSGEPVVLMHHYGFDAFSTNDWNWWTAAQRRAYCDALEGYHVVALLHGHDHHAAHYRWPDSSAGAEEARRQFGDDPPRNPRSYDVFSCGNLCWVFRIDDRKLIAAHYGGRGSSWDSGLLFVKPLSTPQPETRKKP